MTNANILTTEDGYMFTQRRDGYFTDGDIEFDYNAGEILGCMWQCLDGQYCADGDGLVVVAHDGVQYVVTDQGDPISSHDDLRAALMAAQHQLATEYPAVYADAIA